MQRTSRTLLGFALGLTQLACQGPPSRDDVATVLAREFQQPSYNRTTTVTLAYATDDRVGAEPATVMDIHRNYCLKALQNAGLVTPPQQTGTDRVTPFSGEDVYVWTSQPTPKAAKDIMSRRQIKLWTTFDVDELTVKVASPQLANVTGITAPTQGMGQPYLQAQFSFRWAITPLAQALSQSHEQCVVLPSTDPQPGIIEFSKYDDGWRSGEPQGQYGESIKPNF